MTLVIILLLIIVLLVAAIIAMMITGWPGRQQSDIERLGADLRREIAESRGDSIRLLQSIRSEVEDAVEETLNREIAFFARHSGIGPQRSQTSGGDTQKRSAPAFTGGLAAQPKGVAQSSGRAMQLSLFAAETAPDSKQAAPPPPVSVQKEPVPPLPPKPDEAEPMERVQAVIYDDIPDIGDIADLDDLD